MEPMDRRVLSREELTRILMERVSDFTKIGPTMQFIDSALRLQNDMSRPVYILELVGEPTRERVEYINDIMTQLGVACALVPPRTLEYVGEATDESFGVRNIKADVFGLKDGVRIPVAREGERDADSGDIGDEPGGVEDSERGGEPGGGSGEGAGED